MEKCCASQHDALLRHWCAQNIMMLKVGRKVTESQMTKSDHSHCLIVSMKIL
jgi:hypothetical protein